MSGTKNSEKVSSSSSSSQGGGRAALRSGVPPSLLPPLPLTSKSMDDSCSTPHALSRAPGMSVAPACVSHWYSVGMPIMTRTCSCRLATGASRSMSTTTVLPWMSRTNSCIFRGAGQQQQQLLLLLPLLPPLLLLLLLLPLLLVLLLLLLLPPP